MPWGEISAFHVLISRAASEARGSLESNGGKHSAVVKLADVLLERAIGLRASDLHLEPQTDRVRIRYRVDGILQEEAEEIPLDLAGVLIARLKVLAGMDTARHQCPQDGHIEFSFGDKQFDIRASILPAIHGEMMVLRFMDAGNEFMDIDSLGFSEENKRRFRRAVRKPAGLVLLVGPVNSGKSVALYAALQELNTGERNLVTLENPVERIIQGVNQVEINPKAGLDYVTGLKALLRQDIDAVMVGEIRDAEVSSYAVRIALTGHLIMSTLHTENAVGAVFRLREMGIPAYMLAATLSCVVAQRLVRRRCPDCLEEYQVEDGSQEAVILGDSWHQGLHMVRNVGCGKCHGTGYRGRVAVQEVLEVNGAIREAVLRGDDRGRLQKLAEQEGLRTMWQDGLDKVLAGLTSIEEICRCLNGPSA